MKSFFIYQAVCFFTLMAVLTQTSSADAIKNDNAATDQHIREIVENLLREKDQRIEQLEARIKQLENTRPATQAKTTSTIPAVIPSDTAKDTPIETLAVPPGSTLQPVAKANSGGNEETILNKLGDLGDEVAELKESAEKKGLDISGFFDVNAKTDNSTDQTFSVGSVELDLEYNATENLAGSSALVLCGNSPGASFFAPTQLTCGGSGPGGINADGSGIAVAFIDYHMFDHAIPPRGRIFNNQGFHIQAGRFDLPFSSDYQNFANKDRVTITAPITTARMQFSNGFNSDGIRSYGSWKQFNYSAFWTDGMYADNGTTLGGRLGMSLGQNNYRSHKNNPEGIEAGFSYLADLDKNENLRHTVYGVDISLGYGFLRLQNELMLTQAYNDFEFESTVIEPITGKDKSITTNYGKPHEFGYHSTLLADLERFIDYPVIAFIRYGRWEPKARKAEDFDGTLVSIDNISALSVGLNFRFNDYLKLKFEYTDSLGSSTRERYFDKKLGIAQMVVSF